MPLALALLSAAFPPERRGAAIGMFSAVTGLAVASGPLVGGAVVQGINWQWIFWLNVPIALGSIPPIEFFRSRSFSAGNAAIFLLFASLSSAVFFYAQLLQMGEADSPLGAGLRLLPWTATFKTIAPIAGTPGAPGPRPPSGHDRHPGV